jgi:hypothetical protein
LIPLLAIGAAMMGTVAVCEEGGKEKEKDDGDGNGAYLKPNVKPKKTLSEQYGDMSTGIKLFTGSSNRPLAQDIANHLGMSLGKISVGRFADGEVSVQVNENVRG